MYVLMIGTLTGKDYAGLLQEEGAYIAKARSEGLVRDVYLKADQTGPVLLLAGVTAEQARVRMATQPFIEHGVASFDFIELVLPSAIPPATD